MRFDGRFIGQEPVPAVPGNPGNPTRNDKLVKALPGNPKPHRCLWNGQEAHSNTAHPMMTLQKTALSRFSCMILMPASIVNSPR